MILGDLSQYEKIAPWIMQTYGPDALYVAWDPDNEEQIAQIEEALKTGTPVYDVAAAGTRIQTIERYEVPPKPVTNEEVTREYLEDLVNNGGRDGLVKVAEISASYGIDSNKYESWQEVIDLVLDKADVTLDPAPSEPDDPSDDQSDIDEDSEDEGSYEPYTEEELREIAGTPTGSEDLKAILLGWNIPIPSVKPRKDTLIGLILEAQSEVEEEDSTIESIVESNGSRSAVENDDTVTDVLDIEALAKEIGQDLKFQFDSSLAAANQVLLKQVQSCVRELQNAVVGKLSQVLEEIESLKDKNPPPPAVSPTTPRPAPRPQLRRVPPHLHR